MPVKMNKKSLSQTAMQSPSDKNPDKKEAKRSTKKLPILCSSLRQRKTVNYMTLLVMQDRPAIS
jgi:hypothetical protein